MEPIKEKIERTRLALINTKTSSKNWYDPEHVSFPENPYEDIKKPKNS
jgi:hypothetical protein